MDRMILAAFASREAANQAVTELAREGYTPQDISVAPADRFNSGGEEKSGFGVTLLGGLIIGAAIGTIVGWLAGGGIFPSLQSVLMAGSIAAAWGISGLAAATISGAVTGALIGGIIASLLYIVAPSQNPAKIRESILLTVPSGPRTERTIRELLQDSGAYELRSVPAPTLWRQGARVDSIGAPAHTMLDEGDDGPLEHGYLGASRSFARRPVRGYRQQGDDGSWEGRDEDKSTTL